MEVISAILALLPILIWIVEKANKATSSSSAAEPAEYDITANLKVDPKVIAEHNLDAGDAVKLELLDGHDINVIAQGSSWTPVTIGTITDYELNSRVSQRRAFARIYTINGDLVTLEFQYA